MEITFILGKGKTVIRRATTAPTLEEVPGKRLKGTDLLLSAPVCQGTAGLELVQSKEVKEELIYDDKLVA